MPALPASIPPLPRRLAPLLALALAAALPPDAGAATLAAVAEDSAGVPAPMVIGGRSAPATDGHGVAYQWPGLYFDAAFLGTGATFAIGDGEVIAHVQVDGAAVGTVRATSPGLYRVDGLADGPHALRVAVATEHQSGARHFGGFRLAPGQQALPPPAPRARRMEFIGDSHTVGYGNLSASRQCTEAQVWATTDNTRAFGPLLAAGYGADYRIHAISGRGIVRNYGGLAADTLPQAYPYVLFDHAAGPARTDDWQPQVLVIALGTNDFSTPLGEGERWPSRQALQVDYRQTFSRFLHELRGRHPQAQIVLWATGAADGEARTQAAAVAAQLRAEGDTRVGFVPVDGLAMDGCHSHPSAADHQRIAARLRDYLDALPAPWPPGAD